MKKEDLVKNIDYLKINDNTTKKLKNNNILTIEDLWNTNRNILKDYSLMDSEIREVSIKLQLIGMDLNRKKY